MSEELKNEAKVRFNQRKKDHCEVYQDRYGPTKTPRGAISLQRSGPQFSSYNELHLWSASELRAIADRMDEIAARERKD